MRAKVSPKGAAGKAEIAVQVVFGRKLKEARLSAGLTQAAVAQRARLSLNRMSLIESGRTDVRLSSAARLARAVGVPLRDLLPTR